ncbi:hypothetical protein APHAL10511_007195 [Amanita phalloides]|nr:hypothetical protein APHAL10511_007195 [Amanita phalloides]
MHLYLNKRSHLNSSYYNEDRHVLYKVETPNRFFSRVTTIKSALPGDICPRPSPSKTNGDHHSPQYELFGDKDVKGDITYDEGPDDVDEKEPESEAPDGDILLPDRFAHLATIQFANIGSSRIRYGGEEHETGKFLTKKELNVFGQNRVFTGPDGLEYKWKLGFRAPELVRNDTTRTPIARFHRRRLGLFRKQPPASLEILPEGMHMIDLIMVTFVFIQKIRNDNERAASAGNTTIVE